MKKVLGIRREDKNRWERRVPIIPDHLLELKENYGIQALVQPSELRIYCDEAFKEKGIRITEDLSEANTIFAVKEIPVDLLVENKTYIFFSHTIKGQPYNMGMLKKLMSFKCNLIDYERIVNEKNQRLIFFGMHAGYAGIIETLHAFGQKMKLRGLESPLIKIKQAFEYDDLNSAKDHIKKIGTEISQTGLPKEMCPLVVGFAGYGNVSGGAQEIFDLLPVKTIKASELESLRKSGIQETRYLYKVEFREKDLVKPKSGSFDLRNYYDHPENYDSVMPDLLRHLDILVNCIYWTEKYPRLVTKQGLKDDMKSGVSSKLSVIGDISCDIEGSIEITRESTMPDNACYTYLPEADTYEDAIISEGVTVMAVDNLPCEFSMESSIFFSNVLKEYANDIVSADFKKSLSDIELPYPIKKALILHNGELTDDYAYMKHYI
ncbi:MAG: hypothetical protein K9L30_06340 [Desulfobacterales bacterium]|nr:hypothetical protein [Desulfobacterales bacterium]